MPQAINCNIIRSIEEVIFGFSCCLSIVWTITGYSIQLFFVAWNWTIRATSHTRLRARDHSTSSILSGGIAEPVQVCFTLCLRDQWSMWMQDGCKVYMDYYLASNGSWLMVTWTISKNHLLEVDLTQNRETMTLQMFTAVDLFYFSMVEDPLEYKFIEIAFGWGPGHIWLHTTLEGPWPHYMILEVSWDRLWTLSFELSQFHGHGSWLVWEVALGFWTNFQHWFQLWLEYHTILY